MPELHAKLAPSAASRWLACPGSIRLESHCPDVPSPYAAEGTAAHALAEFCLGKRQDPVMHVGNEYEGYTVTDEMAEAVQVYTDYVTGLAPVSEIEHKCVTLNIEKKFKLAFVHPDIWGTNDASVYNVVDHTLDVVDYKHGRGVVVEPQNNAQLMVYALGAMYDIWNSQTETTKKVISVYKMVDKVRLTIVQPRAAHNLGPIRTWETNAQALMFWGVNTLRIGALETEEPQAALHAGKHCKFCKAVAVCPAFAKRNMALAKTDFDKPVLPEPDQLKPADIVKVLEVSKQLSDWAGQVKAYAQAQLEKGFAIPGFKLVARKANRRWRPGVADQLQLLLGEKAFEAPKLRTPAQLEKAAKKEGIDAKVLAEFWDKPDNGVTIAEDSDKRKAVAASVESDFDDSFLL